MSKSEKGLDSTSALNVQEPSSTHTGKPQASASDAMVVAMLEGMKVMSKDENRRKEIAKLLV